MKLAVAVCIAVWIVAPALAQDPQLQRPTAQSRAAFLCLAYGEGFVPVPGTDTCVRAGGDLETGVLSSRLSGGDLRRPGRGAAGKGRDDIASPGRGHGFSRSYTGAGIDFEAHTPTEIGTIDTHIRVQNWQLNR